MNAYLHNFKPYEDTAGSENDSMRIARERMLDTLRARGIKDDLVLHAMAAVPRHEFIPGKKPEANAAYGDHPLPIGHDQTISQPYIVAYMAQRLVIAPGQNILEIGSGCGYQAAVLAEMGANVTGMEVLQPLIEQSRETLARLGYDKVRIVRGDGHQGYPETAPYDRIVVSCAPDAIPDNLLRQLAASGRLIAPVGTDHQRLVIVNRAGQTFKQINDLPVRFVPMISNQTIGE